VDGSPVVYGESYAEGQHNIRIEGEFFDYSTSFDRLPFASPTIPFYVDLTPPVISITKPLNNVSISTADLMFVGNVSDAKAGLGLVRVYIGGDCGLKKDLFDHGAYKTGIGMYCSKEHYPPDQDAPSSQCDANIGVSVDFPISYNLGDYLDLSSGKDCVASVNVSAEDRVANGAFAPGSPSDIQTVYFTIDQASPGVAINEPAYDMTWTDPSIPVISGTAEDISDITDIWLTIKDEKAQRWWNGTDWRSAKMVNLNATEKSGTNHVNWKYTGLTREALRGGVFMITAYAKDKFGHVGQAYRRAGYKKHYLLGEKIYAQYLISMKDVRNSNRAESENPYSFTTKPGEHIIGVSAEFTPAWLGRVLSPYVEWTVTGVNPTISGTPKPPHTGNPSVFYLSTPPIIVSPMGRSGPMGYDVSSRVNYGLDPEVNYEKMIYENPMKMGIYQDEIDKCRQEYVDLRKNHTPDRNLFQLPPSPYYGGNCGAYIMLPATIEAYNITVGKVGPVRITSKYRNPIYNASPAVKGATESPHMYGKGMDLAPDLIDCTDKSARVLRANQMKAIFNAAPSPKLLEKGAEKLVPGSTADNNDDDILDVYDSCLDSGGADHVHIGSGNY
jgi:hypothetical protein